MLSYKYLFDLALILLSTKLLGLLTKKFQMPQVVGALLAGLILGPAMFNVLNETEFIKQLAELGVIVLMFNAGLETDIKELKKTGLAAFVIAVFGILVSFIGGISVAYFFNITGNSGLTTSELMQNIFIGLILVSTSVSISVETLKEMGKLSTKAGNAILGAAIIDDILGLLALAIITSVADTSVHVSQVLIKIVLFIIISIIIGVVCYKGFDRWIKHCDKDLRRFVVISFVGCLLFSYIAQEFFGVSDIIGAFIVGLIISNTSKATYITSKFETLSYLLLSPIFFASIGIKVDLSGMNLPLLWFSIALLMVAIVGKVIGCGFGAKICNFTSRESLQVGTGMIARGEVGLIVASKGAALGLMSTMYFAPVVVVVIVTPIITPILLKLVFKNKEEEVYESNELLIE